MPLPTPPSAASAPETAANGQETAPARAIKQFGRATDDAGNQIPAPQPLGVDLVAFNVKVFNLIQELASAAGTTVEALADACQLNKESVPGHKHGRITYRMAAVVANVIDDNASLTKKRGTGGVAAIKDKNAKLESKLEKLMALMASKGIDVASLLKE